MHTESTCALNFLGFLMQDIFLDKMSPYVMFLQLSALCICLVWSKALSVLQHFLSNDFLSDITDRKVMSVVACVLYNIDAQINDQCWQSWSCQKNDFL